MFNQNFAKFLFVAVFLLTTACQRTAFDKQSTGAPASLREVPALKLNFRFEPDTPAPEAANKAAQADEKSAAVQNDFDTNRAQQALDKVIFSPDKQRIVAAYRKAEDLADEFRLDMYSADGKLLRQITPGGMAVRYPDTIVWSPDSNNIAFVARARTGQNAAAPDVAPTPPAAEANTETNTNADANTNTNANTNVNTVAAPDAPKAVLTFRTEQIYTANREGADLKPLTQNEGLIYFYFVWSPDSSALVALAATWREWQIMQSQADLHGEIFVPAGRPRLVEKNGRERRLDDNITAVQPVWSPDSSKVALAFDKDVRIYDAIGDAPTQAAIPLRNPLLISSKIYDEKIRRETENANSNANANTPKANSNVNVNINANANINANLPANTAANNADVSTLPDENSLVSFNPIIQLLWTEDKMLYVQTGYVKEMKNAATSPHSFLRWHRLVFSPQAVNY